MEGARHEKKTLRDDWAFGCWVKEYLCVEWNGKGTRDRQRSMVLAGTQTQNLGETLSVIGR